MIKLKRESKILIILTSIAISLIVFSIIYPYLIDWGMFWGLFLFIIYQGIPMIIARYKTDKEEEEFEKKRSNFKVFIAKRLSAFKSLEILSISYSLLFGLFFNIHFTLLLAGYQAQALFISIITLGMFGSNFLFSTITFLKFHYLANKVIYPKEFFEKFKTSEDIPEDISKYLDKLRFPYFVKESIKYNLYLHFLTLLPFILAIRF